MTQTNKVPMKPEAMRQIPLRVRLQKYAARPSLLDAHLHNRIVGIAHALEVKPFPTTSTDKWWRRRQDRAMAETRRDGPAFEYVLVEPVVLSSSPLCTSDLDGDAGDGGVDDGFGVHHDIPISAHPQPWELRRAAGKSLHLISEPKPDVSLGLFGETDAPGSIVPIASHALVLLSDIR